MAINNGKIKTDSDDLGREAILGVRSWLPIKSDKQK
jgi:hypothetical protein